MVTLRRAPVVILLILFVFFRNAAVTAFPEVVSARRMVVHKTMAGAHHTAFATPFLENRLTRCIQAVVRIWASLRNVESCRRRVTVVKLARRCVCVAIRVCGGSKRLEPSRCLLSRASLIVGWGRKITMILMAGASNAIRRLGWKRECYLPDRRLVLLDWLPKDGRKICEEKLDQGSRDIQRGGENDGDWILFSMNGQYEQRILAYHFERSSCSHPHCSLCPPNTSTSSTVAPSSQLAIDAPKH